MKQLQLIINTILPLLCISAFNHQTFAHDTTSNILARNDAENTMFTFEADEDQAQPYLFVSLGYNCWPAQALRDRSFSLRDAAYPFDWLLTPDCDSLVKCLDENFKSFTEASCFERYDDTHVENTHYKFKFSHDWPYHGLFQSPEQHTGQLEHIKNKYTRRIERFRQLKNFKGKVFFLRCFPDNTGTYGERREDTINLNNALKRFFPKLSFTLVIESYTNPAISEIGEIEGVKEYKIKDLVSNNFQDCAFMFEDLIASL